MNGPKIPAIKIHRYRKVAGKSMLTEVCGIDFMWESRDEKSRQTLWLVKWEQKEWNLMEDPIASVYKK